MYIILDNKKEYTNDFLNYVIRMMFMVGLSQLNNIKEKLPAIDQYLGKIYNSRRTFFSYQIIISGLKNIIFKRTDKDIVLKIDDITKIPYTTKDDLRDNLSWDEIYDKLSDEEFDKVIEEKLNEYEPYWKKVIQIRADV